MIGNLLGSIRIVGNKGARGIYTGEFAYNLRWVRSILYENHSGVTVMDGDFKIFVEGIVAKSCHEHQVSVRISFFNRHVQLSNLCEFLNETV